MTSTRTRLVAALVAAPALALTACGSDGDTETSSTTTAAETSETSSSTSEPAEEATAGGSFVAKKSSISFVPPEGWAPFDVAAALADPAAAPDVVRNAAEANDDEVADFLKPYESVDAMAFEAPAGGFAANLNVINNPGTPLPSAEDAQASLEQNPAITVSEVKDQLTPIGDGRLAVYEITEGDKKVAGEMLFVEGPKGLVVITLSTLEAGKTASAMQDLAGSLGEA